MPGGEHEADEELRKKVADFFRSMTKQEPSEPEVDNAVRGSHDQQTELADLKAQGLPEDKMQRALEAEQTSIIDEIRSGPRPKQ